MESALSKARSVAARTVHIKISPTPQNLSESRVVLQELEQKFGEVTMFRSLKVCTQFALQVHLHQLILTPAVPPYSTGPERRHSDLPHRKRRESSPRSSQPPLRAPHRALSTHHHFRRPTHSPARVRRHPRRNGRERDNGSARDTAASKGVPARYLALGFRAREIHQVAPYEPIVRPVQAHQARTLLHRCGAEAIGAAVAVG